MAHVPPRAGVQNLAFRRAPVLNNYSALLTDAYLRASGRRVASYDVAFSDTGIEEAWQFA